MKTTLWNRKLFKSNNDSNTSLNSTHSISHPTPLPLPSNPSFNPFPSFSRQNRSTPSSGSFSLIPTNSSSFIPTTSSPIPSTSSATTASSPAVSLPFINTTSQPRKQRGLFFGFQNSSVQSLLHLTFHSNSSDRDLSSPSSLRSCLLDPPANCSKKEMVDSPAATSSSTPRSALMESTTIYYHPPPPKQEDGGEDILEGTDTKKGKENKNGEAMNRSRRDEPSEIGASDQCRRQQQQQQQQQLQLQRKEQSDCRLCHHHQSKDRLLSLALFDNVEELRQRRRDLGQLAAGRLSAPDIRNPTSSSMAPARQASPTPTHYSQQEYRSASTNSPTWHTKDQIQHHRRDCEYAQQLQHHQQKQKQQKHSNENDGAPGVIVSLVDWKVNRDRQQQQESQKKLLLDKQLPNLPGQGAVAKDNSEKKSQRKISQSAVQGRSKGLLDGLSGPQQPVARPHPPPPPLPLSIFASRVTSTHRTPSSSSIKPRIKAGHTHAPILSPPPLSALASPPPTTPLPPTPTSRSQAPMLPSPLPVGRPVVFFPSPPPPQLAKPVVPTVDTSISCSSSTSTSPSTGELSIDNLVKVVDSLSDTVETLQRKIATMLMLEEQANASPGTTINIIRRGPAAGKHLPEMTMKNPVDTSTGTNTDTGAIVGVRGNYEPCEPSSSAIQSVRNGRGVALERRSTTAHCLISGVESQARRNIRVSTQWTTTTVSPDLPGNVERVDGVASGAIASGLTTTVAASLASPSHSSPTQLVPDEIASPIPDLVSHISSSRIPARPSRPDGSSQELKEALEVIDLRLVLLQYDWPRVPSPKVVSATLGTTTTAAAVTTEPRPVAAPSATEVSISPPSSASSACSSSSTFFRPPPPPSILTAPTTTPSGYLAPASPAPRSSASLPLTQSNPYPFLTTSATSEFLFPPPPALPLPSLPAPPAPPPTSQTLLKDKAVSSYACELVRKNTHRCQTLDDELQCMVDRLQNELRQQYRRQQQRRRLHERELASAASPLGMATTMTTTTTMGERRGSWKAKPARTTSLTLTAPPPPQEYPLEKSSSHRRRDYRNRGGVACTTGAMATTSAKATSMAAAAVDSEDEEDYLADCGPETRQLLDSIEEIRKRVLEVGRLGVGMSLGIGKDSSSSHSSASSSSPSSSAYPSFDRNM